MTKVEIRRTVKLERVTTNPVAGQPVVWNVIQTPRNAPLQYNFDPGDGTRPIPSSGPTIQYTYAVEGNRVAIVTLLGVRDPPVSRDAVRVTAAPVQRTVRLQRVTTNPVAGQPVVWNVIQTPQNAPLQYNFDPGDGTRPIPSSGPTIQYTYAVEGNRVAIVTLLGIRTPVVSRDEFRVAPATPRTISLQRVTPNPIAGRPVVWNVVQTPENPPLPYEFDPGDGTTPVPSRSATVEHTYATAGARVAVVKLLRVPSPAMSRDRVVVAEPPPPALNVTLQREGGSTRVGDVIRFRVATSRRDPVPRVTIDFRDGETLEMTPPGSVSHVFRRADTYNVSAVAVAANARAETTERVVITPFPTPTLVVTPPTADPRQRVRFTTRTVATDPRIRFRFQFGDGTAVSAWQTSPTIEHDYANAGTFTAQVEIGLPISESATGELMVVARSGEREVTIRPGLTVAIRTLTGAARVGEEVGFGITTTRPDLRPQYTVTFGDGTTTPMITGNTVTHTFLRPGDHRVTVVAAASTATAQGVTTLTVAPLAPPTLSATPSAAEIGEKVEFSVSPVARGTQFRYRFDFNDGSAPSEWLAAPVATHSFTGAGSFRPSVEVGLVRTGANVEALGIKSEAGVDVLPALRVTLRPDKRIHVGEETSFLVETNRPGAAVSLDVAFGDGSPNDTAPLRPAIRHVYAQKGKYTVSWTATAARTQARGEIEVIVATAVSLPPWWVVVIGSVALVSTAGLAAHRLGWVRPTLHLKANVRSVRAISKRAPDLEIEYRLKHNLPGCRVRFVVRPKTSTAEPRKTYV